MTATYLHRVLAAVQALAVAQQPLTVRAIARRMGYRRGWGQFPVALHHLRRRGYVDFVDFKDGSIGTLRYPEPEIYL